MKEKKSSFIQFAEKLLQLKEGEKIEFQTEPDEGYAWAALKLRLLDADVIVVGIYGGGDTYLYDMTGDGDSPEYLENFLVNKLQCHTKDGIYLK